MQEYPDFTVNLDEVTSRLDKRTTKSGPGSRLLSGPLGEQILELAEGGWKDREIAEQTGASVSGVQAVINRVQKKQGILLEYRAIQHLQLTELQGKILNAITPEKIEEAPLRDLVLAYKVLKDKEPGSGGGGDIKGLVGFLIQLEKEEVDRRDSQEELPNFTEEDKRLAIDVTCDDLPDI